MANTVALLNGTEEIKKLSGTGRPLERLVHSLTLYANASKGGELGKLDVHEKVFERASTIIEGALNGTTELDQTIALALQTAIENSPVPILKIDAKYVGR